MSRRMSDAEISFGFTVIAPIFYGTGSASNSLRQRGNIRWAETERLKFAIDAARSVMRSPARGVFEQANGADASIRAEIEPMWEAGWNPDQVAGFDLDGDNLTVQRMKMK